MSNVTCTMAQYRYSGSGCLGDREYLNSGFVNSKDSDSYQDVKLWGTSNFEEGKDYWVTISIKRDLIHDMVIDLKLSPETSDGDSSLGSQYLDYIRIPKVEFTDEDGNDQKIVEVAYYDSNSNNKTNGENLTTCILKEVKSKENAPGKGVLCYTKDENGKRSYWLRPSDAKGDKPDPVEWKKYCVTYMRKTWTADDEKSESEDEYEIFNLTFRPVATFKYLVLELERDPAIDPNVINGDGKLGRRITLGDQINLMKAQVVDLASEMKTQGEMSSITRIGVWGRHGLLMCINGEPIKIGPNNYYEQDALPIESLGVVAGDADWDNNFTIDYVGIAAPKQQS